MSDNRTKMHPNIAKNTQNSLDNDYNLYSKKLQVELDTSIEVSDVSESIESGLDFMLWHFEGQHSIFPRNIATGATRTGQKTVYDKDRAILFIQGALRQDCYLSV